MAMPPGCLKHPLYPCLRSPPASLLVSFQGKAYFHRAERRQRRATCRHSHPQQRDRGRRRRLRDQGVALCTQAASCPGVLEEQERRRGNGRDLLGLGLLCALGAFAWTRLASPSTGCKFGSIALAAGAHAGLKPAARSAWAGLAAGCLHSLSGPDHLAALTPLTIGRSSVGASLLGAWWGFGHCIGQLFLGLAMLLLKDRFEHVVPVLSKYSSLTIGATLIAIGVLGLRETLAESAGQEAEPAQDTMVAAIPPTSGSGAIGLQSAEGALRKQGSFNVWTLATGVVYGLQPDALFVVLPALALPTKLAAVAYMAMFVLGTVTAMGSYTAFIGATSKAIQTQQNWMRIERLSAAASGIALVMGICIALSGCGVSLANCLQLPA